MATAALPQVVVPDSSFRKQVEHESEQNVSSCYQCEKCTNGCPLYEWMDIQPHKVMRCVQLGLKEQILKSQTIWLCASCETCSARCPNGIDIAHVMDSLRQLSQREQIPASQYNIPIFHNAFLGSIRRHGRVHEGEMAVTYYFENESWAGILKLASMGFLVFLKGKVKLRPNRVHAVQQVKDIFRRTESKG